MISVAILDSAAEYIHQVVGTVCMQYIARTLGNRFLLLPKRNALSSVCEQWRGEVVVAQVL